MASVPVKSQASDCERQLRAQACIATQTDKGNVVSLKFFRHVFSLNFLNGLQVVASTDPEAGVTFTAKVVEGEPFDIAFSLPPAVKAVISP